jgi:hypothetical protein
LVDTWVRAAQPSRTTSYCSTGISLISRMMDLQQMKWKPHRNSWIVIWDNVKQNSSSELLGFWTSSIMQDSKY